ncbi:hypothetical protein [Rhizomicrobium electricum]|jgi:hypothetical protein|uniref:Uncharacterized protein n=1 Tax=Rhizomicrobium electricum TaxID=480070 RepID=A0ABN1F6D9_9PROT|nr:hypothetical protein [Rhizomicrobium electricum]NIJ50441.1 hypothetical protein [Rhizomicrobium electricum]
MKMKKGALQPLIVELDNIIAAARAAKLEETVALLRMARLDLMMRAHGIATNELELVSFALARGFWENKPSKPAKSTPQQRERRTRRKSPH